MFYQIKRIPPHQYPQKNTEGIWSADFPLLDIVEGAPTDYHYWWSEWAPKYEVSNGEWLASPALRDFLSKLNIYPAQLFTPLSIENQGVIHEYYRLTRANARPSNFLKNEDLPKGQRQAFIPYDQKGVHSRLVNVKNVTYKKPDATSLFVQFQQEKDCILSAAFAQYDLVLLDGFHDPLLLVNEKTRNLMETFAFSGLKLTPVPSIRIDHDGAAMAAVPPPLTLAALWQSEMIDKTLPKIRSKKFREFIQSNTRPALHIEWQEDKVENLPPQASRLFGKPALPPGFEWPKAPDGTALAFIAQFNLEHIAGQFNPNHNFKTPQKGMLAFFLHFFGSENYLQGQKGYSRVCYFPDTEALCTAEFPKDAPWMNDLEAHEIVLRRFDMIPDRRSPVSVFNQIDTMSGWELLDEKEETLEMEGFDFQPLVWHLFGFPKGCQASMEYDAAMQHRKPFRANQPASTEESMSWISLFNFSAEGMKHLHKYLGDGDFCFLIRQEDWMAMQLEEVQVVGQWT